MRKDMNPKQFLADGVWSLDAPKVPLLRPLQLCFYDLMSRRLREGWTLWTYYM